MLWLPLPRGEPLLRIGLPAGKMTISLAYGGPDRRTLDITEFETGSILDRAHAAPGKPMFSHAEGD